MGKVKEFQICEDGYVKVVLQNRKDVDSYMLECINQEKDALPCMLKKRTGSTFLYDARNMISLEDFFSLWKFHQHEVFPFIQLVVQTLGKLEKQYPYLLRCDAIFTDVTRTQVKVMILPIHDHYNSENNWSVFLETMVKQMQLEDDAILGWFYRLSQRKELCAELLVQACELRRLKPKHTMFTVFQKRAKKQAQDFKNNEGLKHFMMKKAFTYQEDPIKEEIVVKEAIVHGETVVLFASNTSAYLELHHEAYQLPTACVIGRGKDCDYQISSSAVSSHHARIEYNDDEWWITDLHSCNGTTVNQMKLQPHVAQILHTLDDLLIADVPIRFHEGKPVNEYTK